jgi:hypothetical protein
MSPLRIGDPARFASARGVAGREGRLHVLTGLRAAGRARSLPAPARPSRDGSVTGPSGGLALRCLSVHTTAPLP